jgi:hypothetical protein
LRSTICNRETARFHWHYTDPRTCRRRTTRDGLTEANALAQLTQRADGALLVAEPHPQGARANFASGLGTREGGAMVQAAELWIERVGT